MKPAKARNTHLRPARLVSQASEAGGKSPGVDDKGKDQEIEMRSVPVTPFMPDDMRAEYADVFNVFFTDYDFTITFLQSQAPLIFKDEDWDVVEKVKVLSVARVVVPPHIIPRIINILTENWTKFMEIRKKQQQELKNASADNREAEAAEGNLQP